MFRNIIMSTETSEMLIESLGADWAGPDDMVELRGNFDYLLQAVEQSGVVPFVGAGLSAPFGYPAWTSMLLDFGHRARVEKEIQRLLDNGQYEEAADNLRNELGATRFEDGLREAYSDARIPAGDLGGAVAQLPSLAPGPVITTNFDRVLETIFERAGTPFKRIFSGGGGGAGSGALQTSEQVLLKVHGDLADAEHRILTFGEYETHYGPASGRLLDLERELPRLLHQILIHRPILFLGCSLRQDRTVTLLLEVAQHYGQIYHYAVLEKPADEEDFRAQRRHLSERNVRPLWYPTGKHALVEAVLLRLVGAAPPSPRVSVGNLPPAPDLFVGRQREITEVRVRLRERRLVSLLGAGGTGKTSLAIEVGRACQEDFPDGVWCIELASIEEPALVPLTIARTLGLREQAPEPPTQVLATHLRRTRALLILDNCEHLVEACRKILRELLTGCPDLRFLTTSRRGLRMTEQAIWPVPALETPAQECHESPQELLGYEAVQLFVEAAQDFDPSFQLQHDNTRAVATIVDRLNGIPLAIRLAASALRRCSVYEIADQLDNALELLASPNEASVPHQRTLRSTLEWSYGMLEAEVQALLRGLSIFSGSFSRADMVGVCGLENRGESDLLERLQNHSLVEGFDRRRQRRFRLLEVVRQFARQHLRESGQEEALLEAHSRYFLTLAEEARDHLLGDGQVEWLDRLEQSHSNLRAVASRALRRDDTSTALHLAACLWRFWEMKGYLSEGRDRLREVLELTAGSLDDTDAADRAEALHAASNLAYRQGDLVEAETQTRKALAFYEQQGDRKGIASAWNDLGNIARQQGDIATADEASRKSFTIKFEDPEIGTPRELGVAYFNLAMSALHHGRLEEAEEKFDKSLHLFEEVGNQWECGFPLHRLGMVALLRRDFDLAERRFRSAYERRKGVDDKRGMGDAIDGLARTELWRGQTEASRDHLRQALTLRREVGDERGIVDTLEAVVFYLQMRAQFDPATRLYAVIDRIRQRLGTPTHPLYQPFLDEFQQASRRFLGVENFERLLREGRAMTRKEALDLSERLE